jgi:hypothetical protein
MQYPGVFCGHILTPLDAWLFTQINGGNCISLMLNQGYGWASDVNLKMIFDALFNVESGVGYPPHRQTSQRQSRQTLETVSSKTHLGMVDILKVLPSEIVSESLAYPGIFQALNFPKLPETPLKNALKQWR